MKRSDARENQRVRVTTPDGERVGRIVQVGDERYPGLKNAARVSFPGERDQISLWYPIDCLQEE